jgi:hypothetical protein
MSDTLIELGTKPTKRTKLWNRLQTFVTNNPVESEQESLHKAMSMDIRKTGISPHSFVYLDKRGVKFVGEVYAIYLRRPGDKPLLKIRAELRRWLHIPADLTFEESGWRPPYWSDPKFRKELNRPHTEYAGRGLWQRLPKGKPTRPLNPPWCRGYSTGKTLIRFRSCDRPPTVDGRTCLGSGKLARLHEHLYDGPLHAAMLIPPNWSPFA